MALTLAIVGRPNVGKSTLFNRLAGKKLAIVDDRPGVTRDRRNATGRLGDIDLALIDTAGFENQDDESLAARMQLQMQQAIDDADVVALVVDAREGITPLDRVFVELLRRKDKPVVLLANKAEGRAAQAGVTEAFSLGLGEPLSISAEHGDGLSDLYDALAPYAAAQNEDEPEDESERPLLIAVIGRPNAGKSTLVNTLIGEERMLTGPEAGITRDSIRVDWTSGGRRFRLVDTAGIRRKALVNERLEQLSVQDALRAINLAEVVLLVMDATHPFEVQDLQLADLVEREGRALVFVLAKWDLIDDPAARLKACEETAESVLPQLRGAPLVALSAETGRGLGRLIPAVLKLHGDWSTKVKTRDLNDWLKLALERHPPPAVRGRRVKPKYMAQTKSRPPTFVLMASAGDDLPESYRRYMVNSLRESFDLPGTPIRLIVRKSRNPYVDGDSPRARPKPNVRPRRARASSR
jgi:GTP-binding protein